MKFGQGLKAAIQSEWESYYINYKQLKKEINKIEAMGPVIDPESDSDGSGSVIGSRTTRKPAELLKRGSDADESDDEPVKGRGSGLGLKGGSTATAEPPRTPPRAPPPPARSESSLISRTGPRTPPRAAWPLTRSGSGLISSAADPQTPPRAVPALIRSGSGLMYSSGPHAAPRPVPPLTRSHAEPHHSQQPLPPPPPIHSATVVMTSTDPHTPQRDVPPLNRSSTEPHPTPLPPPPPFRSESASLAMTEPRAPRTPTRAPPQRSRSYTESFSPSRPLSPLVRPSSPLIRAESGLAATSGDPFSDFGLDSQEKRSEVLTISPLKKFNRSEGGSLRRLSMMLDESHVRGLQRRALQERLEGKENSGREARGSVDSEDGGVSERGDGDDGDDEANNCNGGNVADGESDVEGSTARAVAAAEGPDKDAQVWGVALTNIVNLKMVASKLSAKTKAALSEGEEESPRISRRMSRGSVSRGSSRMLIRKKSFGSGESMLALAGAHRQFEALLMAEVTKARDFSRLKCKEAALDIAKITAELQLYADGQGIGKDGCMAAARIMSHSLILLKNFSVINLTAVRKILKKFLKRSPTGGQVATNVNGSSAVEDLGRDCQRVDEMLLSFEDLLAEVLFSGDQRAAAVELVGKARNPATERARQWATGGLAGVVLLLVIVIALGAWRDIGAAFRDQVAVTFQAMGLFALLFFGLSVNLVVFAKYRINYHMIMGVVPGGPESMLPSHMAGVFLLVTSVTLAGLLLHSLYPHPAVWVYVAPLALLGCLALPFKVLYPDSRRYLLRHLYHAFLAPLFAVEFSDIYITDQLVSIGSVATQVRFALCSASGGAECSLEVGWANPLLVVVASLPAFFRALQCLRRARDDYRAGRGIPFHPHFDNIVKYAFSIAAIVVSSVYAGKAMTRGERALLGVILSVQSSLGIRWDLTMDYKLLEGGKDGTFWDRLLRKERIYPLFAYIGVVVATFSIRLLWLVSFTAKAGTLPASWPMIIAFLEISRRCIWNFFRMEVENIANKKMARAVPKIIVSADAAASSFTDA